ncbi:MAG: archaeosortase/exosortase family protein [Myxococcales bacterium]
MEQAPSRRREVTTTRIVLVAVAALVVAALQIVLAVRAGAGELWLVSVLAWGGALFVANPGEGEVPGRGARLAGALFVTLSLLELATPQLRVADRLAPLAAGAGLLLVAGGFASIRANGRALLLLCLPLLHPPPRAVREVLDTSQATAFASGLLLRAFGVAVERHGTLLVLPDSSLTVAGACSGINQMCELLAVAVLAAVLLETTARRSAWLAASAVAVGFAVNAARIAFLAMLADGGQTDLFELWHEGSASLLVSGLATAVWGTLCVLVVRYRVSQRRERAVAEVG